MPEDMLEAYDYAVIAGLALEAQTKGDKKAMKDNIDKLDKLTNRDDLTMDQIGLIRREIKAFVNYRSFS